MAPPTQTVTTSTTNPLMTPVKVGAFQLEHRVVMPPLTRCRAIDRIPQPIMAKYYGERATKGGLIISEGTPIAENGHGYPHTPGINRPEQVEAWKPVTQAVREKGGVFFAQLWHVGRASHQDYCNGELPISSSPIAIKGQAFSLKSMSMVDHPVPRPLEVGEIQEVVQQFKQGALNAREAGFDGVEIHAANSYLIDQFLRNGMNKRTDAYGGSIENRCKFALEVVDACCAAIGSDRVGIRLSPFTDFLDGSDSHPYALYTYLLEELNKRNLAYVHLCEPRVGGNDDRDYGTDTLAPFRAVYRGTVILAGGYDQKSAAEAVSSGAGDLVAFGRHFCSTPDLVERVRVGAKFNPYDRNTFYTWGEEGYLGFPTMAEINQN